MLFESVDRRDDGLSGAECEPLQLTLADILGLCLASQFALRHHPHSKMEHSYSRAFHCHSGSLAYVDTPGYWRRCRDPSKANDHFRSLVRTEWVSMLCLTAIGAILLALDVMHDCDWQTTSWVPERVVGTVAMASMLVLCWTAVSHSRDIASEFIEPQSRR